jgi:hypothetical protein
MSVVAKRREMLQFDGGNTLSSGCDSSCNDDNPLTSSPSLLSMPAQHTLCPLGRAANDGAAFAGTT